MFAKVDKSFVLGIDASRNRSGGAIAYLKGILSEFSLETEIREIHIWASASVLQVLPDAPWLIKHTNKYLEGSLFQQIFWQFFILRKELVKNCCNILFSPDATSFCIFPKHIVLSQDLLAYEPSVMDGYKWGRDKFRLKIIKLIQNFAFKRALGVLFLTNYAANLIQRHCGKLSNIGFSPHGVDEIFIRDSSRLKFPLHGDSINCIYVSASDLYKNQWHVVRAISRLRMDGFNLKLTLVGGAGNGNHLLLDAISECDAAHWVDRHDFLDHSLLPDFLAKSDIFIFASSCENLPITLLEGMAFSMPIACSKVGPMPEVLVDGGVYFDPINPASISDSIYLLIKEEEKRYQYSSISNQRSRDYTWRACSQKTFGFIIDSYFNSL